MGKDELRQWQWIVRALWSAASKMALGNDHQQQQQRHGQGAGAGSAAGSAAGTPAGLSSRRPMCQLQLLVPDTILFERGEPCKWIGCSTEGIVVRKSFVRATAASIRSGSSTSSTVASSVAETSTATEIRHATLAERTGARYQPSSSGALDEVEVMERMDIVLAALSSFAAGGTELLSTSSQSAAGTGGMDRNSPVCVARYNDGTMEILSETSLRALSSFYNWRASLCALQAYVRPSTSTGTRTIGTYVRREEQPRSTRAPKLMKTTRDESRVGPEPTTDFDSGCSHAGDDEPRRDKPSAMRTFSSVVAAPFETSSTASPGAMMAADGGTLAGPATKALVAELDEATKDVAFVADMSYARPIESPPRAARRMSTATASSKEFRDSDEGTNSVGGQISSGRDQPAIRSACFIGAPTGQPRRCRPPWPKSRVRISRLEAEYVIDQAGRAWFTKATKVLVQSVRKPPAKEASEDNERVKRKRLMEETVLASSVAARELRAVVGLAGRRGLTAQEIFQHFVVDDAMNANAVGEQGGRVGRKEIMAGMANLGIALSEEASDLLIKTIVRSSADPTPCRSTEPAAASQVRGSVMQPQHLPRKRGSPASVNASSLQRGGGRSSTRRTNRSPPPLRRYVTAEDLWNFASSESGNNSKHSKGGGAPLDDGENRVSAIQDSERRLRATQDHEPNRPNRASHGGPGPSPKRRRRKNGGHSPGGGTDTSSEEQSRATGGSRRVGPPAPSSAGCGSRSDRPKHAQQSFSKSDRQAASENFQGSLSTISSVSSAHDPASVAALGIPATGPTKNLVALTAGRKKLRPHSMLAPIGSVGSEKRRGLQGRDTQRRWTEPTRVYSASHQSGSGLKTALLENGELASFPCHDPAEEARNGKDRVFHVDRGLVIAYRVLRHPIQFKPPLQQNTRTSSVGDSDRVRTSSSAAGNDDTMDDDPLMGSGSTLMAVVPGLFQTLDTLEKAVLPLVNAHPGLTALLVAPPGLPNTHWPAAISLNGELTAMCVSTLLEHLLEGDDLLPTIDKDENDNGTSQKIKPERHPNGRPTDPQPEMTPAPMAATLDPSTAEPVETTAAAGMQQNDIDAAPPCPSSPKSPRSSPSTREAFPVIFVGFGFGAHSLLHLAAGPLRTCLQPPKRQPRDNCGGGCSDVDDFGDCFPVGTDFHGDDKDSGIGVHEQQRDGGNGGGGGIASDGRLASALYHKGLRAGGLVLVNGFVALDEQSTQARCGYRPLVVGNLRQAFCDQSDGLARTEAIASLLFSANYEPGRVAELTTASSSTVNTYPFLDTREAFCLDAAVSAYPRPQNHHGFTSRTSGLLPDGTAFNDIQQRHPARLPLDKVHQLAEVGVESVLREMDENGQKRKQRLFRQHQQRQRKHAGRSDSASPSAGERFNVAGEQEEEEEVEAIGDDEGDDGQWPSPQHGRTTSSSSSEGLGEGVNFLAQRLALAASVSILDGLILNRRGDDGSWSGSVSSGHTSVSGGAGSGRVIDEVKRAGLPLLMVQGTEDALIGSPLALVLKQELLSQGAVDAEAGSVLECFMPTPPGVSPLGRVHGEQTVTPMSSVGEVEDEKGNTSAEGDGGNEDGSRGGDVAAQGRGGHGLFRTHTCWVKAGHDVLHERGPFLRALLNKSIYACHGRDAPPTRFPEGAESPTNKGARINGSSTDVATDAGGGGQQHELAPLLQADSAASRGINSEGRPEWLDDGDRNSSSSQEERRLFYRREEGLAERNSESTAYAAGANGGSRTRGAADAAGDDSLGPPYAENNSTCGPYVRAGRDSAVDGGPSSGGGTTVDRVHPPSTSNTGSTSAGSSVQASAATSVLVGRAAKLVDFFDLEDAGSRREFQEARDYVEEWREFSVDRAIVTAGLGATGERLAALDLPLVARYTFQTMKECWRCRALVVEVTRLDLGMRKRQAQTREQLALSIRTVNNMVRTLRKSNSSSNNQHGDTNNSGDDNAAATTATAENNGNQQDLLHLEPLDQQALKAEIAAAEVSRATNYAACRKLRRAGAVFAARRERLESTLAFLTGRVRGTLLSLERIMGQLRKHLALARVQERVFHEEVVKAERMGLKVRRRLEVVREQLSTLGVHPHKWTDSDAWQPGYMQRHETVELVKMLEAEGRTLQTAADEAYEQSQRARELHGNVFQQESALVSTMQGVGALFSLLNTALEDENFVRDAETVVEVQTALEQEVLGLGSGKPGRIGKRNRRGKGLPSAEARVRATPHRNRTPDEKRWVALDAVVNPQLYHHVTLAEAEEMRWDALYYTRLDREDILRVLSLPPQVQLALPFLHTPDEVAAHELLARYSLGISADHFAQQDKTSQDACDNPNTATASSSMTAAAEAAGDDNTAPGSATAKGAGTSHLGWRDDILARATQRVFTCMLRAAEAELASPEDRDDEEAIWCVLDRKLRPQLYHDSDERAADRAEELHREADAREDARHTWLTTPEGNSPRKPAAAQNLSTVGGSRHKIETVVEQQRAAERVAALRRVSEDREMLALGVADSVSEEYLKALAASVSVGGLPEVGVEETGREQEGDRRLKATPGGENGAPGTTAVTRDTGDDEARMDAARHRESSQSAGDDDDRDEKEGEQPERRRRRRRRLVDTVQRVLSRFLVAEEETPLGRDMTRSLAMLQEVALRLGRG
ncbi:unnamed protein product, partial [Ectocarpus sp. 12 AP-2014]